MSWRTLFLSLVLLLILTWPFAGAALHLGSAPLYVPEVLVLGLLVIAGLARSENSRPRPALLLDAWLILGSLLFFFGAFFSFVANPFSVSGLGMFKTWFVFPLLFFFLLVAWRPNEPARTAFLKTWLFVATAVAGAALEYFFSGRLTFDGRLQGWLASPNFLAIFIAPGVLIAVSLMLKNIRDRGLPLLFPLLSLALLLVALYLTKSYGAWLGVFGGILVVAYRSLPRNVFSLALLFLGLVGASFFSLERNTEKWQALVGGNERSSLASRMMIWQSAGKMIGDQPILGIGLGRFQEVYLEYQKYFPPYLEWAVPQPHNLFLAVWLQAGVVGLAGFLLVVGRMSWLLWQKENRETGLLLGLLMMYLLYGFFDTPYFATDLAFAFWLLISLAVASVTTDYKSIR